MLAMNGFVYSVIHTYLGSYLEVSSRDYLAMNEFVSSVISYSEVIQAFPD